MEMIKLEIAANKKHINHASKGLDIKTTLLKNDMMFEDINKLISKSRITQFDGQDEFVLAVYHKDKHIEESIKAAKENQKKLISMIDELIESVRG